MLSAADRMSIMMDKVHTVGMSEHDCIYLTVKEVDGVTVEPPIRVAFEGEDARAVVAQEAMAVRYNDDELRQIGEGNSMLGLRRVIGDIAMNGPLERGATKPLHPNLLDRNAVVPELPAPPAPPRELTA